MLWTKLLRHRPRGNLRLCSWSTGSWEYYADIFILPWRRFLTGERRSVALPPPPPPQRRAKRPAKEETLPWSRPRDVTMRSGLWLVEEESGEGRGGERVVVRNRFQRFLGSPLARVASLQSPVVKFTCPGCVRCVRSPAREISGVVLFLARIHWLNGNPQ